jgi:hypothetical protein
MDELSTDVPSSDVLSDGDENDEGEEIIES